MNAWRTTWTTLLGTAVGLLGLTVAVQVSVDPYGVWDSPVVRGFNHVKEPMSEVERLFKPFQSTGREPDVVLLGTSRVAWCFPPHWPGKARGEVYNHAYGGGNIVELADTFDAIVDDYHPEVVVLGLDAFLFSERKHGPGFSPERLSRIGKSELARQVHRLTDATLSLDAMGAAWTVLRDSRDPDAALWYRDGWRAERGRKPERTARGWATYLERALKEDQIDTFHEVRLEHLQRIVDRAEAEGVRLVPFFPPVHADYMVAQDVGVRGRFMEELKRAAVEVTPYWDFWYVGAPTVDAERFHDASHCLSEFGEQVLDTLAGEDDRFGVWVTPDTIDEHLARNRKRLDQWRENHPELEQVMERAATKRPNMAPVIRELNQAGRGAGPRRREVP